MAARDGLERAAARSAGGIRAGGHAVTLTVRRADPVLASYLRFWDAVVAANRAADPSMAALRTVAADPELSRVRATVSRNKVQKLSLRGDVGHSPRAGEGHRQHRHGRGLLRHLAVEPGAASTPGSRSR